MRSCYFPLNAEVAEFGRRAGLRIQWSNPWGFESPLSHYRNLFGYRLYETQKRDSGFLEKEGQAPAAAWGAGQHQSPAAACPRPTGSQRKAARYLAKVGAARLVAPPRCHRCFEYSFGVASSSLRRGADRGAIGHACSEYSRYRGISPTT